MAEQTVLNANPAKINLIELDFPPILATNSTKIEMPTAPIKAHIPIALVPKNLPTPNKTASTAPK